MNNMTEISIIPLGILKYNGKYIKKYSMRSLEDIIYVMDMYKWDEC
jgi:hypothetical protein